MGRDGNYFRTAVVLSAGGLRGAAHLGVLRQLLRHNVPIDLMVGVSAGAIIAGFYAGVGLSIEDMVEDARTFRGRHIVLHGLTLRAPQRLQPLVRRFCGVVPERLRQLDRAEFDNLHFGVRGLGIVCHDLITNRPMYFASGGKHNAMLPEVIKASATIPGIIPSRVVQRAGRRVHLVDGGLSDPMPIAFARSRALQATHLIVCDCRTVWEEIEDSENLVYIRPRINGITALRSRASLLHAVELGEAAVTDEILRKIKAWRLPPRKPIVSAT